MNRVFISIVSRASRSVFSDIIQRQIDDLRKTNTINLKLYSTVAENDSPLVVEIKKNLEKSQAESIARLGSIGAELISSSSTIVEDYVAEARRLRKEAKEKLNQAREIHNSQQHMLNTGDVLPLANALGLVVPEDQKDVTKHLKENPVLDYFARQNSDKAE